MSRSYQQVFTKSIKYLGNHLTTSGRNVSQEQKMYWNLYRKYEVGKDESQRLEHIEDILHRNEEEMSSTE